MQDKKVGTMDLRKKESGILVPFVLDVINSVRNTYFVKEIFFQLFCFMDMILRLHMYPENMYSVPSLKITVPFWGNDTYFRGK